jgi:hypothetical protein
MMAILFPYFENLIKEYFNLYRIIDFYSIFVIIFFTTFGFSNIVYIAFRDFLSPKENKEHIISFLFYLFFQIVLLTIIIFFLDHPNLIKGIYFYLKNLINVQLISLKNDFIMIYTSTIFLFFILTIIIVPIDLIYNYINKIALFINTKYNLQIILTLLIFGIIGIIYSSLLNNLRYLNIINLADIYLVSLFLTIYLLLLGMVYINRYHHHIINTPLDLDNIFIKIKHIKERNVKKIKRGVLVNLIAFFLFLGTLYALPLLTIGFIPWYVIIFLVFYLYIIFEIIVKRYFSNKETFYQDISKLNKYFNKHLLIIFGALTLVAIFDTLNLFLLRNYTLQIVLQPIIIESNLLLQSSLAFSANYVICFLIYCMLYYLNDYLQHVPRYYISPQNINYKVDDSYGIKNIQVNPIITIFSYLALFIVFLINLML